MNPRLQNASDSADPLCGEEVTGLNFTAVDFETANGFRGSPCAVGLVRIRDGRQVDTLYQTMRPPEGFDRFDPRNVQIHGLSPEQVADRPRFAEIFPELSEFIGTDLLVAHNASFDIEVFESALEVSGMDSPGLRALCSVRLARAAYQLPSHALPHAAAEAGYQLRQHHWALEDARACAAVVVDISRRRGISPVLELFSSAQIDPEEMLPWRGEREYLSRATRQVRAYAGLFDARTPGVDPWQLPDLMRWQDEGRNLAPHPDADPQHPLFGEQVVFSGTLAVPRGQAKELVARCGAQTSSRVTAGTTLVVIGDGVEAAEIQDALDTAIAQSSGSDLWQSTQQGTDTGSAGASSGRAGAPALSARKVRESLRRAANGQQVRMITEGQLRKMLGPQWPEHLTLAGAPGGSGVEGGGPPALTQMLHHHAE